ncbi:aldehyde dehydrogenase family protein [Paracoccus stylophorae]|uniref:Aldehyde dehydrogenase family protein n=1 Tax=Paracoccus stylophorae TaxID=659350 RepID=A0ABY7SSN6_9RHOB|nr:aldehyde dehydrogenase family protein [Paracoccus stylophorae]WCR09518.1 aldehyde dehydrogenase family protein [Paracoccus stylophorae]
MNVQPRAATSAIAASDGVFIDNTWQPARSGATLEVIAPATGKVITRIADGDAADIDAAVAAARRALQGAWGALSAAERGRILACAGALVEGAAEELAWLEAHDTGKPIAQARADIAATARYLEFYGGAADKVHGDTIPFLPGHMAMTEYVPLGVTGHIIPWNYPAQMFGRTIAASLAMGNACVLKPAEDACLTPLRLCEILRDAGLPDGALNCVPGRGEVAGAALAAHPGVDFLSFTGSPETGAAVQIAAAHNHIGCTLELGGKSPQILFADADLDRAMPVILKAITQNAGQTCSAGARLLVQDAILPEIAERLRDMVPNLTAAAPESDRDLGPLISRRQLDRVRGFCAQADADGIPLIAEGRIDAGAAEGGNWIAPRAYGPVPRDHALARQEVFGPILSLMRFTDEADAIALANDTEYGLVAGVWSQDGSRALRVARRIVAGQVFVNAYGAGGGIELPFGGMKKSGHGREKGFDALYEFAAIRTMVIRHD